MYSHKTAIELLQNSVHRTANHLSHWWHCPDCSSSTTLQSQPLASERNRENITDWKIAVKKRTVRIHRQIRMCQFIKVHFYHTNSLSSRVAHVSKMITPLSGHINHRYSFLKWTVKRVSGLLVRNSGVTVWLWCFQACTQQLESVRVFDRPHTEFRTFNENYWYLYVFSYFICEYFGFPMHMAYAHCINNGIPSKI